MSALERHHFWKSGDLKKCAPSSFPSCFHRRHTTMAVTVWEHNSGKRWLKHGGMAVTVQRHFTITHTDLRAYTPLRPSCSVRSGCRLFADNESRVSGSLIRMQSSRAHVAAQSPTLPRSHKHKGAVSLRRLSSSKGLENGCCLRGSDCIHRNTVDAAVATDTVEAADR